MQICTQALCAEAKNNMYMYVCADANTCTGIMCRGKKPNVYICADANMCTCIMCRCKEQ